MASPPFTTSASHAPRSHTCREREYWQQPHAAIKNQSWPSTTDTMAKRAERPQTPKARKSWSSPSARTVQHHRRTSVPLSTHSKLKVHVCASAASTESAMCSAMSM